MPPSNLGALRAVSDRLDALKLSYLIESVRTLIGIRAFDEALPGQIPPDEASQQRLPKLREKLRRIAALV